MRELALWIDNLTRLHLNQHGLKHRLVLVVVEATEMKLGHGAVGKAHAIVVALLDDRHQIARLVVAQQHGVDQRAGREVLGELSLLVDRRPLGRHLLDARHLVAESHKLGGPQIEATQWHAGTHHVGAVGHVEVKEIDAQVRVRLVELKEAAHLKEDHRVVVLALKLPVLLASLRQLSELVLGNKQGRRIIIR